MTSRWLRQRRRTVSFSFRRLYAPVLSSGDLQLRLSGPARVSPFQPRPISVQAIPATGTVRFSGFLRPSRAEQRRVRRLQGNLLAPKIHPVRPQRTEDNNEAAHYKSRFVNHPSLVIPTRMAHSLIVASQSYRVLRMYEVVAFLF